MTVYFGENLKHLRKAHNISQTELALKISKVSSTLSNWETGKQNPDIMDFAEICNFFKIPTEDMLFTDLKSFPAEHVVSLKNDKDFTLHKEDNKLTKNTSSDEKVIELLKEISRTILKFDV